MDDASASGAGAAKGDSAVPMSRIGLNDHKAGMKGLDKNKINEVSTIYQAHKLLNVLNVKCHRAALFISETKI